MRPPILSSGIIPVKKDNDHWVFLLLRCYKYWDFPKGETEQDELPWQAAKRELQEETGISKIEDHWNQSFIETPPYTRGKVARYYLAEVKNNPQIQLLPNPETGMIEHHEYRWMPFEEARELLVPRVQVVIDWAQVKLLESQK